MGSRLILALSLAAVPAIAAPKRHARKPNPKPDPAAAQRDAAIQQHVTAATSAYGAGDFDAALTELAAALQVEARPDLMFAIGQVYSRMGRCDDARASFEQYRDARPGEAGASNAADAAIAACKPPAAAPAVAERPPPPPPPAPRRWYTDVAGDALVGGGVIALVTAAVEYGSARSTLDDAEHAPDLAHYTSLVDSAHGKRTFAAVIGGVGAALVVGGLVHYRFHTRAGERRSVAVVPLAGGGLVTLGGDL